MILPQPLCLWCLEGCFFVTNVDVYFETTCEFSQNRNVWYYVSSTIKRYALHLFCLLIWTSNGLYVQRKMLQCILDFLNIKNLLCIKSDFMLGVISVSSNDISRTYSNFKSPPSLVNLLQETLNLKSCELWIRFILKYFSNVNSLHWISW